MKEVRVKLGSIPATVYIHGNTVPTIGRRLKYRLYRKPLDEWKTAIVRRIDKYVTFLEIT